MLSIVLLLGSALAGTGTLSGQVVDDAGKPVPGARVFLEPGVAGALVEVVASADGAFRFEGVAGGATGVFAIADGHAFGGQHVNVALADAISDITICLERPGTVRGKICDFKGRAVEGARITRVGLLGETKVGIPLAKLDGLGLAGPVSGADGRFSVGRMPYGGTVALKISHPQFAQEAMAGLAVGAADVQISMDAGVMVQGTVRSREADLPVLNAIILVRNVHPPHDTALSVTDASGRFALRLKPGTYLYQAAGAAYRSIGWRRLTVTGRDPQRDVALVVVGVGAVGGKVCDAVSGDPISGAHVVIEAAGKVVDFVLTGPAGLYSATTTEGENIVRIEPVPGYRNPELVAQRVRVVEGEQTDVPTFWMAPIPAYTVQILDQEMAPATGAVVQVIRPAQFGWRVADKDGYVSIQVAAMPDEGTIIGRAEHATEPLGALFALRPEEIEGAKVKLMPLGSVNGRIVTAKDKPIEGAVVGARFAEGLIEDPPWLWRTVSGKDGLFAWTAVVPHVSQRCVAVTHGDASGSSAPFTLEPDASNDLGRIVVTGGSAAKSLLGKSLKWYDGDLVCGTPPDKKTAAATPAFVMYCDAAQAPAVTGALARAQEILDTEDILFAVVVDGAYECDTAPIAVVSGQAPTPATTYLLGSDGKVVLETFGMPPVHSIRDLCGSDGQDTK